MTKKFFTKASPKAAGGIRRLYEGKGYKVRSMLQTDGTVTVVAVKGTDMSLLDDTHRQHYEEATA